MSTNISIIDEFFGSTNKNASNNTPKVQHIDDSSGIEPKVENIVPILGIDLGTTHSCISIWRNNKLEIIPDEKGNRTIPSMVAFTNKMKYVGWEAKNQIELNPKNVFYEVKRIIGRKITDPTIKADETFRSYELTKDDKDNVLLTCHVNDIKKILTPEEVQSNILIKLKQMATNYLKMEIKQVVITVPADFNDSQRQATKDAATIAGLECVRLIHEPTSAALAYGLETKSLSLKKSNNENKELNIIVYDLGGGTLDVSLLTICDGVFEVIASNGNTHLGGSDVDNRIMNYCMNKFKTQHNIDKFENISSLSLQYLRTRCENAKKILSTSQKTYIAVRDFYNDLDLVVPITQKILTTICRDFLILCLKPLEDVLTSCGKDKSMIDELILVGGMTRMPAIRENLKTFFGREPNSSMNPEEVVSAGAAIQGYILSHRADPFSESITLLDITPLSLGVEVIGGVMNILIPRNTVVPAVKKKRYTTDSDFETSVTIKVYEGERKLTKHNRLVGEFELKGIESAPRGYAKIEVVFSVDQNGIIKVTATDLRNKDCKNEIVITSNKGRLTNDEIQKLVKEARESELNDKIEKEKKQAWYEIEELCSNITINIKNDDYKLREDDQKNITEDITKIISWLKAESFEKRKKEDYDKILDKLKKKYGTLILRNTSEGNENIKSITSDHTSSSTTIYGNEDDEDDDTKDIIFDKIEEDEMGIGLADQNEKNEVKVLRSTLLDLCNNIFEMLSSTILELNNTQKKDLRDYIDEVLLWIHIEQKITKKEYKLKIDEVNSVCDKIFEQCKGNNTNIFGDDNAKNKTTKDELEQLCYSLKASILSNIFSLHEDKIELLDKTVDNTLEWLINLEVELKNNTKSERNISKECQDKINEITELCNKLYQSMLNVTVNRDVNILFDQDSDIIVCSNTDTNNNSNSNLGTVIEKFKNNKDNKTSEMSNHN